MLQRSVIAILSALVGVLVVLFVTDIPRDEQRSMLQIVIEETPRLESWRSSDGELKRLHVFVIFGLFSFIRFSIFGINQSGGWLKLKRWKSGLIS